MKYLYHLKYFYQDKERVAAALENPMLVSFYPCLTPM